MNVQELEILTNAGEAQLAEFIADLVNEHRNNPVHIDTDSVEVFARQICELEDIRRAEDPTARLAEWIKKDPYRYDGDWWFDHLRKLVDPDASLDYQQDQHEVEAEQKCRKFYSGET